MDKKNMKANASSNTKERFRSNRDSRAINDGMRSRSSDRGKSQRQVVADAEGGRKRAAEFYGNLETRFHTNSDSRGNTHARYGRGNYPRDIAQSRADSNRRAADYQAMVSSHERAARAKVENAMNQRAADAAASGNRLNMYAANRAADAATDPTLLSPYTVRAANAMYSNGGANISPAARDAVDLIRNGRTNLSILNGGGRSGVSPSVLASGVSDPNMLYGSVAHDAYGVTAGQDLSYDYRTPEYYNALSARRTAEGGYVPANLASDADVRAIAGSTAYPNRIADFEDIDLYNWPAGPISSDAANAQNLQRIDEYKAQYESAKAQMQIAQAALAQAGNSGDASVYENEIRNARNRMEVAHRLAEETRAAYGYSGGIAGDEYLKF